MQFNSDKNKQAVQVIFSCRKYKPIHPSLIFNQSEVVKKNEHTHLGMILDSKLNFNSHLREAIIKARRGIGIIRYLSKYVFRDVLDQIYKLYVWSHSDYSDIIYHKYDPEHTFELTVSWNLFNTRQLLPLAAPGGEPTLTDSWKN